MPTNIVTMRQIRETLRLHLQASLSYNEVGRALKISKSVVGKYVSLASVASVDWELAQTLSDEELEARVYRPALPRGSHQLAPDCVLGMHGCLPIELMDAIVTVRPPLHKVGRLDAHQRSASPVPPTCNGTTCLRLSCSCSSF